MYEQLHKVWNDLTYINVENTELLHQRWHGKVYIEIPYTHYQKVLQKSYLATSNYCWVFAKVPFLFADTLIYNYSFYQSQLVLFVESNNFMLAIGGFYNQLSSIDIHKFYQFGKVYQNNNYKKLKI
jgi:hypothetical protein